MPEHSGIAFTTPGKRVEFLEVHIQTTGHHFFSVSLINFGLG
jgi:hypothetical protein